jgi:predicted HAD superfamily phosphohydrolase YqeG
MTKTYFNAVSTDKLVWKNEEGKEIEVWLKEHRKKGWKWKVLKSKERDKRVYKRLDVHGKHDRYRS